MGPSIPAGVRIIGVQGDFHAHTNMRIRSLRHVLRQSQLVEGTIEAINAKRNTATKTRPVPFTLLFSTTYKLEDEQLGMENRWEYFHIISASHI